MRGALEAGDLDAARVVNDAIGKLLAPVALARPDVRDAPAPSTAESNGPACGAAVVDIDAKRRERGG